MLANDWTFQYFLLLAIVFSIISLVTNNWKPTAGSANMNPSGYIIDYLRNMITPLLAAILWAFMAFLSTGLNNCSIVTNQCFLDPNDLLVTTTIYADPLSLAYAFIFVIFALVFVLIEIAAVFMNLNLWKEAKNERQARSLTVSSKGNY
jgi:hypothetical protein